MRTVVGWKKVWAIAAATVLVSGCLQPTEALDDDAVVEDSTFRDFAPRSDCAGATVPTCPTGLTGPACTLTCEDPTTCDYRLYCHGDGSQYGLAAYNAYLYQGDRSGSDALIEEEFLHWIDHHGPEAGLPAGASVSLERAPHFRMEHGPLTVFRFVQSHAGLTVASPDNLVRVAYNPFGAIQVTGRLIDADERFRHQDQQASSSKAVDSIRHHTWVRTGVVPGNIAVDHLHLVAFPAAKEVAWSGIARQVDGSMLGKAVVSADPTFPGAILPLWSFSEGMLEGLGDEEPVSVRSVALDGAHMMPALAIQSTLLDGQPLVGSIDDLTGDIQLATDRVVVLDLGGGTRQQIATHASRYLNADGEFLASMGEQLRAQVVHHSLHDWYELTDRLLTTSLLGIESKGWDSANAHYAPMFPSAAPPGTFQPRMLAFMNAQNPCGTGIPACVNSEGYPAGQPIAEEFPELVHQPAGPATNQETTMWLYVGAPLDSGLLIQLAHEFGHQVDGHVGPGGTLHLNENCGLASCPERCRNDTTDEGPPLGETFAQMVAQFYLLRSFDAVDFEYCGMVGNLSRSGTNAFDPGPCIPPGGDISLLARPGSTCAKSADFCDKPMTPGFRRECCDPTMDAGCTIPMPTECTTGWGRNVPLGVCDTRPGYNTHSILQAFWQMLNGQACDATPPFACETTQWPDGVDPADAAMKALLYSMRLDPLQYSQLFDGMATYIACNYGEDVYDVFNHIACTHGLRACGAPAPTTCSTCGNGVREGAETCDGQDWAVPTCSALPTYVGGTLSCDPQTCQLDLSGCIPEGATDGSTGDPTVADVGSGTGHDTSGSADDGGGSGGCDCRTFAPTRAAWLSLLFIGFTLQRRRRA